MKRKTPRSAIERSFSFLVLSILTIPLCFAQDCKTQAANKPSTLLRGTDDIVSNTGKMNAAEMAKMKPYLAKAESWTKKILTNFTGAKLLYHNNFFPKFLPDAEHTDNMFVAAGIKGHYSSQMMFFAYYCYENSNTIQTEAESGSTITVNFNNVFAFGFTDEAGVYKVNGRSAFKIIKKKRSEGRIDFYEQRTQDNATAKMFTGNDYIILRNSDKPLFIPVTRKEYLEQMLKEVDISGAGNSKMLNEAYESNAKMFELEMKVYRENDKSYTPEKEAKRRKWFEEDQEKLKKNSNKIGPDATAAKEVILQYLQKPTEWLNRAIRNFYSSSYNKINVLGYLENLDKESVNGAGEKEETTLEEIITINPAYFNKTLSNDVPQVIMLHLRNGTYAYMEKVAALVKQPGALAPLEAMLNPGKATSPVTAPVEITSTYSLKYLPKLKTLSPLTAPAGMKPSLIPVTTNSNNVQATGNINFVLPALSSKLSQLPQLLTAENYNSYIKQLHNSISTALKPSEKKKADDYVKNKKITQSNQLSNTAFAAWLKNSPTVSLYLYSSAVIANPSDALAANNFSAFLIMGGSAEKSIPIL